MRAEFEERQKSNPMNSLLGGGGAQPGANPMGNFDMAAFLAGTGKKDEPASPSASSGPAPASGGSGGSNGKKEKGVRR